MDYRGDLHRGDKKWLKWLRNDYQRRLNKKAPVKSAILTDCNLIIMHLLTDAESDNKI